MSEQPKASNSKPAEPKLCKMGCGFFGSNVTGDYCSRCYASISKTKKESSGDEAGKVEATIPVSAPKSQNDFAQVSAPPASGTVKAEPLVSADVTAAADPPSPAKKKKKIKKKGYKSMMAGMLEGTSASRDIEKEKEKLKEVTGGGHFQKIDKI